MSFVNIKISGPTLAPEQICRLQQRTTSLMADVLGKKTELNSVLVEQTAITGWSLGATSAWVTAHVDAKVAAGTYTPEGKASFIAEVNALLRQILGAELPIASYVAIDEIPDDAWGYDGLTQEHRKRTARQSAAA
jgi:4-oxalocrotonate tautomerase